MFDNTVLVFFLKQVWAVGPFDYPDEARQFRQSVESAQLDDFIACATPTDGHPSNLEAQDITPEDFRQKYHL